MELPRYRASVSPSDFYAARPTSSLSLQQPRVASSLPAIAVALRPKHESSTRGAPFSVLSVVWVHVIFNNNGFFHDARVLDRIRKRSAERDTQTRHTSSVTPETAEHRSPVAPRVCRRSVERDARRRDRVTEKRVSVFET